ncbi:MAG: acylneuraminate cytidylyltransferase family protein [Halopseudomonas sp.]
MKKRCIAFIFARGGSKGLPGKNIKPLNGKPLIAYSIDTAKQCPSIVRIIVSTDDAEIAEVAKRYGAEVPFTRPEELAGDTSSEWDAWRHAVNWVRENDDFDTFVSLPATAPLRSVDDVERCIAAQDADTDMVVTVTPASRSPYFNMVTIDESGFSELVIKPEFGITRRQDAPAVYDMTTVAYVTRPDHILEATGVFSGTVKSVVVPPERAVDIDTALDFKLAELITAQGDGTQC